MKRPIVFCRRFLPVLGLLGMSPFPRFYGRASGRLGRTHPPDTALATRPSITVAGSLLTEKYSSFCTCSVRVLCELGSRKGTSRRSKEDRTVITTSKMGGATVMLVALTFRVQKHMLEHTKHSSPWAIRPNQATESTVRHAAMDLPNFRRSVKHGGEVGPLRFLILAPRH
jgi:hypothetical protein